jgi:alpha-L-rhamnosidase
MNQRLLNTKQILLPALLVAVLFLLTNTLHAQAVIDNLQVEYTKTPIGIDVKTPRFSWQMTAPAGERKYAQTGYQLEVKDAMGTVVWNSKKMAGGTALGIVYAGMPLKAATRYNWAVSLGSKWQNRESCFLV